MLYNVEAKASAVTVIVVYRVFTSRSEHCDDSSLLDFLLPYEILKRRKIDFDFHPIEKN